eukprot:TRINITY_DN27199_c0_g1_i1.p1 TRINITY_DN27199_c0_g1~~TRINITY_DN27199_c0_g1_i1.p1  ORF type:complete len:444 (+),score=73.27 TRINITY_DN27199_c0_g1_i1:102-1433(+)
MGAALSCSDASGCDTSISIPGDSSLASSLSSKINLKVVVADDEPVDEAGVMSSPESPANSSPSPTAKHELIVERRRRNSGFLGNGVKEFEGRSISRKSSIDSSFSRKSTLEDSTIAPSFKRRPSTGSKSSTGSAEACNGYDSSPSSNQAESYGSPEAELLYASRSGKLTAMEHALAHGADLHCADKVGRSPLFLAAGSYGKGNLEIIKRLIAARANIEAKDHKSWTPLHFACCDNRMDAASVLVNSRASVNVATDDGRTPVVLAILGCNKRFGLIRFLIENKADLAVKDREGASVLWFACQAGYGTIVQLLLKGGADPNDDSDDGLTPLMIAARQGDVGLAKLLHQYKVDLNVQGLHGNSALMEALQFGMSEFANWMMEAGATTLQKNKAGLSCADIAEKAGLLSLKARLDQRYRIESGEAEEQESAPEALYLSVGTGATTEG